MAPPASHSVAHLKKALDIDCHAETEKIASALRNMVSKLMKKRGLVVGVSGGIDSSVTLALCVKAVGKDRVLALMMPEQESRDETIPLGQMVADRFGVLCIREDITEILTALNFYNRYIRAIQTILPEYGPGWKSKILTSNVLNTKGITFFSIFALSPDGRKIKKRLDWQAYLRTVAAMNFKQRTRKMIEYYHADRLNYAVAGTPNRLEYELGFFVKNGDGAADVKPIAHLYKSQVYQLSRYLGIPEKVVSRDPTTDTYSLAQGQDEFYFSLPHKKMDLCLYGKNNEIPPENIGKVIGLTAAQVEIVYKDIDQKRNSTRYLHLPPLLLNDIHAITDKINGGALYKN